MSSPSSSALDWLSLSSLELNESTEEVLPSSSPVSSSLSLPWSTSGDSHLCCKIALISAWPPSSALLSPPVSLSDDSYLCCKTALISAKPGWWPVSSPSPSSDPLSDEESHFLHRHKQLHCVQLPLHSGLGCLRRRSADMIGRELGYDWLGTVC